MPISWPWSRPSRAFLERELAVAEVRLTLAEHENRELRDRLVRTEREYAKFRDAALVRSGTISAPVTDATPPVPASPLSGVLNALQLQAYESRPSSEAGPS